MHHVHPNMAEISLRKRQRIRLIVVSYRAVRYIRYVWFTYCLHLAFLNSAQCFGITVTVQLQPVVESLGLFT